MTSPSDGHSSDHPLLGTWGSIRGDRPQLAVAATTTGGAPRSARIPTSASREAQGLRPPAPSCISLLRHPRALAPRRVQRLCPLRAEPPQPEQPRPLPQSQPRRSLSPAPRGSLARAAPHGPVPGPAPCARPPAGVGGALARPTPPGGAASRRPFCAAAVGARGSARSGPGRGTSVLTLFPVQIPR